MKRSITAEHERWLQGEVRSWQGVGLIDDQTGDAILGSYSVVPGRRLNLAKLLLTLGAAFVGIGVIWLMAANLDALSPNVRFGLVLLLWLGALVGAESVAGKRAHGGSIPSPVVGALRLLAALLLGGVIFQAAQSLQVPAFEARLLGYWALGSFLYAYLFRAAIPLVVGIATGTLWLLTATLDLDGSPMGAVLALLGAALLSTALSTLHRDGDRLFATMWREVGAAYALATLFLAAIPMLTSENFSWRPSFVIVLVAAAVALAAVGVRRPHRWLEPTMVLAIGAIAVVLMWWEAGKSADNVDAAAWLHAGLAVTAYLGAALWVAYLGIVHDSPRLTIIATAALVVFTTFQSFAVFAQIIQGAWLFVVLGLVLAGSGYFFDRARRELEATVEGNESEGSTR